MLAYSGGLDTSIIIPWLKENYNNCEVVAVSGDVGQGTELDGLEEKAKATGASKLYVLDLKKDFVENYIFPTLKFGAKYEDYLLGTSFARPCIAKALADIAIKEGADAICHGCTGKGNDQVRFELTLKALCPDMAIIAPWREWSIKSRDEEIDYAEAHNIPLKINRETNYSKDKNLWHLSHEGLDLEDPANEPQYEKPGFLEMGVSPEQAPDVPTYVTIHFEKGIPTAVDGKEMGAVELVEYLNQLGGENGIGLLDIVENRLVGMKDRGVYESPRRRHPVQGHRRAGDHHAGQGKRSLQAQLAQKYADIVYNGQWFTPLREALDAFADSLEKTVTGDVKLKLYKGNMINAGVTSPFTLYDEQTASFGVDKDYDQSDATGFINLFGLSILSKLSKNWPEICPRILAVCFHTFTLKFPSTFSTAAPPQERFFAAASHAGFTQSKIVADQNRRRAFFPPCGGFAVFIRRFYIMAEQLWKGRFSKAVDSRVNDFNSSIRFDQRMIAQDMRGSGVHAAMLARQGIISEQDCTDILSGLASIADDLVQPAGWRSTPTPRTCTPLWSRP